MYIRGCMCSAGPFQFRWLREYIYSSCYHHHQIGSTNHNPLSYFSVVVCLRCLLHHILSLIACTFWETRDFVFIIIVQFIMSANILTRFGLQIVFVFLYNTPSCYHHCANLSEDIELIKCLSDIFCWVCEYDWAYFLSYPLYNIRDCVFSVHPFPLWWLREYTLCLIIIIKSEVWTIFHCLGLGHETMVCALYLSIFFWIYKYISKFFALNSYRCHAPC